jgi:hypothetical protein
MLPFDVQLCITEHRYVCPKCKSEAVEPVLADFYAMTSKKT